MRAGAVLTTPMASIVEPAVLLEPRFYSLSRCMHRPGYAMLLLLRLRVVQAFCECPSTIAVE